MKKNRTNKALVLHALPGIYAVCRFDPHIPLPQSVLDALAPPQADGFCSLTRTADELSLVVRQEDVPLGCQVEAGWRCLKVLGPLDFGLVGILAGLSAVLAGAGISLFAVSTYDTDYILVKAGDFPAALAVLKDSGYTVA